LQSSPRRLAGFGESFRKKEKGTRGGGDMGWFGKGRAERKGDEE